MRRLTIVPVVAIFFACSAFSDVSKFYQTVPHRSADAPLSEDPEFRRSSGDVNDDLYSQFTAGYELIGYAAFNGKEAARDSLVKQAKKVGASRIFFGAKYTDTQHTGTIGSTSFSRWGALSFALPTSVRRYDQISLYFRKAPRLGIGLHARPLKADEHASIGSNKGMRVFAVVNGSPAFTADVIPGDVILSIDERPVYDIESFGSAIQAAYGRKVKVSILRGATALEKVVELPTGGKW